VLLDSDDTIISSHVVWNNWRLLLKPVQNDSKLLASVVLADTDFGVLEFHLLNSMDEIMRMSLCEIIHLLWNIENTVVPLLK
jgi:hypothetical protein